MHDVLVQCTVALGSGQGQGIVCGLEQPLPRCHLLPAGTRAGPTERQTLLILLAAPATTDCLGRRISSGPTRTRSLPGQRSAT